MYFRLENVRQAMESARNNFDIPLIVTPENLASPDLDELSGMTYLSYFMKVDSPGYFATMKYVNEMIPDQNIRNFQVSYNLRKLKMFPFKGSGTLTVLKCPRDI